MNDVIVLIEDNADIRDYASGILADAGYSVYTADTGSSGLNQVRDINPNLVLLDLKLPDIQGESICKDIKNEFPEIPIIMLTAKDTPEDMARGLNLGADDYIPKPFTPEVLIARVKARLRDQAPDQTLIIGDLKMNTKTHEVTREGKQIQLSPQEFKLLHYFMSNPNNVLTRDMILVRIWGNTPDIQTRVVDVYVGYLRKKIDKGFSPALIQSVRGFGYMLKAPNGNGNGNGNGKGKDTL